LTTVRVVVGAESLWLFDTEWEFDSAVPFENATFRMVTEADGDIWDTVSSMAERCFCIMLPDQPLFTFCIPEKEGVGAWLAKLKQQKLLWWKRNRSAGGKPVAAPSPRSSPAAVVSDPETGVYQPSGRLGASGYLRVYDERRSSWLRTYFVLEDNELLSFKSMYSTEIRDRFAVHECVFHTKVVKGVDLSFQLASRCFHVLLCGVVWLVYFFFCYFHMTFFLRILASLSGGSLRVSLSLSLFFSFSHS
jgi:hypothetical protein